MSTVLKFLNPATLLMLVALAASDANALHLWGPGGKGDDRVPAASKAASPTVKQPAAVPPGQEAKPAATEDDTAANPLQAMAAPVTEPASDQAAIIQPKFEAPVHPEAGTAAAGGAKAEKREPLTGRTKNRNVRSLRRNPDRAATDEASEALRREQLQRLSNANLAGSPGVKVQSSPGAAKD